MKRALSALLILSVCLHESRALAWDLFRSQSSAVERGNEHLSKGQHKEALEAYDEAARELPNDPSVQLDRGLALLALGKLGEAREAFRRAGAGSAPKEVRGPALYDLGSAFMQEADQAGKAEDLDGAHKLLEESVDAFRGSLRALPSKDAAWNLELAKRRLVDVEKKQEEKKKQEEEKKKEEEKKDENKDKSDEEKKDDEDKDDKKEPQPDAGSPKGDDDKPSDKDEQGQPDAGAPPQPEPKQGPDGGAAEPPPPPEPEPGKEEPNALPEHMKNALDALEAGEENLEKQRARQRARQRPRRIEKDW